MPIKLANNTFLSCYLTNWAKNIEYLPKTSASPSEVIFADILEGKTVHSIAIKLFIDVTSTKNIKNYASYYHEINNIEGIKYEVKVYRDIIDKIIEKKQSPNFVRFIGYGDCPMNSIDYINLPAMKANIRQLYGRDYIRDNKDSNIGILVTEKPKNIMPFREFSIEADKSDILQVIFQIVYSLAVIQKYRLVHNDLHTGNILIQKIGLRTRYYKVGRSVYKITTQYQPLIFDWDLSYSDILGKNKKISMENDIYCGQTNICNHFSEKYDLYTFLCLLNFSQLYGLLPLEIKNKFTKNTIYSKKESQIDIPLPNRVIPSIEEKGSPEQIFKRHFQPYIYINPEKGVYKMGRKQLEYAFGKYWVTEHLPNITKLTFTINNGKIRLYSNFICRPNSFDSISPTPLELVKDKMFNSLHANLQDEKVNGPIYTLPDYVDVKVKIHKGSYIPSTRHKISYVSKYSQMHSLEKKYKINPTILNMYLTENTKKTIHNTIYRDLHIFYEDKIIIYYKLFLAIRLLYLFITNFIYEKQYQIDRTVLAFLTIICVHFVTNKKGTRTYMESKLKKAGIRDYTMVTKYKNMLSNFIEETNISQAPCEYNFLELYFQSISKSKINSKKVYNCCKYLGRKIVKDNYFYFLPSKLAAGAMLAEKNELKNILNITGYSESTISNVVNSLK